jgi:hypothetical protein
MMNMNNFMWKTDEIVNLHHHAPIPYKFRENKHAKLSPLRPDTAETTYAIS